MVKGGRAIDYELKYIFILLTAVLRQKTTQTATKQVNWQKIFRYAEYHDVLTLLYHAVLGMEKSFTEQQKQDLYQKYKKELLLQPEYCSAQEAIIWQLEQNHIHALLLSGTARYDFYDIKEMGHIESLEFLVEPPSLHKIPALMYAMDYEQKVENGCQGLFFVRPPGIKIRFLKEIPYAGRLVRSSFDKQLKGKAYVQPLMADIQYIYNVAALMEHYLLGDITIRQILDFWLYREKSADMISETVTEEILRKGHIKEFEQCLTTLGNLWFGSGVSPEDAVFALSLEEYVLNPGKVDLGLDRKILPSGRARLDFYDRDREEEWKLKKAGWLFPTGDYMKQIFPVLERLPFLIGFCWCIRGFRILKKIVKYNIVKLQTAILEKLKRRTRSKGEHEDEKHENR